MKIVNKPLLIILSLFPAMAVCFGAVEKFDTRLNMIIEKNKVMIYVGMEDGLKEGEVYSLLSDGVEVAMIELVKVENYYSTGRILADSYLLKEGEMYTFKHAAARAPGGDAGEPPSAKATESRLEMEISKDRGVAKDKMKDENEDSSYEFKKIQLNYADANTLRDIILSMNLKPPPEEVFAYAGPLNAGTVNSLEIGGYTSADSQRQLPNEQIVTAKKDFLLIKAAPEAFKEIENLIALVDVAPRQVVVKALILELDRSNIDDTGADALLFPSFGRYGVSMFNGNIDAGQFWVGIASRKVLGERMKTFWTFLHDQLLRRKARIVNNPTISTVDGHPALIQVGKEIPIRTSTTNVNEGTMFSESRIDYRYVGTSLYVVPRIDEKKGEISLLIHPVLSEIEQEFKKNYKTGASRGGLLGIIDMVLGTGGKGETESDGGMYPNIIVRETNSIVRLKSGEEVVLGGLIRREHKTRTKKMPLLGDLPVLGSIFRRQADYTDEQELMIILVPFLVDELPPDDEIEMPLYNLLYENFNDIDDWKKRQSKRKDAGDSDSDEKK